MRAVYFALAASATLSFQAIAGQAVAQITDMERIAGFCLGASTQIFESMQESVRNTAPELSAGNKQIEAINEQRYKYDASRYGGYIQNSLKSRENLPGGFSKSIRDAILAQIQSAKQRGYGASIACAEFQGPMVLQCARKPTNELSRCLDDAGQRAGEHWACQQVSRWCGPDSPIPP